MRTGAMMKVRVLRRRVRVFLANVVRIGAVVQLMTILMTIAEATLAQNLTVLEMKVVGRVSIMTGAMTKVRVRWVQVRVFRVRTAVRTTAVVTTKRGLSLA